MLATNINICWITLNFIIVVKTITEGNITAHGPTVSPNTDQPKCNNALGAYLQVEELQAVQLEEEVVGERGQLAAVHVQALQLLQTPEGASLQDPQGGVVPQVQLLQHAEVTEGPRLDPGDVVSVQPQHLGQPQGALGQWAVVMQGVCVSRKHFTRTSCMMR